MNSIVFPQKVREEQTRMVDSTIWDDFIFRDSDIVIATFPKSGTTWTQNIVAQLVFNGAEDIDIPSLSPWLDMCLVPRDEKLAMLEAQRHRRFLKTHLPIDALTYSPTAKYIFVARDGRDVIWSLHNHRWNMTDTVLEKLNSVPGDFGPPVGRPPEAIRDFFLECIDSDKRPLWEFWGHIRGWWQLKGLPNLLIVHYSDLKGDMSGQIRRIAGFLDIEIDERRWPTILEHCGFDYMKRNADRLAPGRGVNWKGGGKTFFNKGADAQWRDTLTAADCALYEAQARSELGAECADWLAHGARVMA